MPSAAVPDLEPSLPANHREVPVIWENLDPEVLPGQVFTWVSLAEDPYSRVFNPTGEAGSSNTIGFFKHDYGRGRALVPSQR